MDGILRFAEHAMGGGMQQPNIQGHPEEGVITISHAHNFLMVGRRPWC